MIKSMALGLVSMCARAKPWFTHIRPGKHNNPRDKYVLLRLHDPKNVWSSSQMSSRTRLALPFCIRGSESPPIVVSLSQLSVLR